MKALALAVLFLGTTAAARAQTPAPDPSLDRMRSVLAKTPLRLEVPETRATFKIEIKAIHPMHEIFDKPAWQLDPIGWQPPGVGLDLTMVFRYIEKVKHEHDERSAREDVQRSIDDYCAVQPNAKAIQICATARPPR